MYLVIIGAGPVGNSLVERALEAGHTAAVVEPDATLAQECAEQHDVLVLEMAISAETAAAESHLADADAVIATTADDSTNLMAMLLAQEAGVERRTSTVNQHSHMAIFRRLGVRVLADPERLVAENLLDMTER
ncbi:TrkA family potassium uptake protein [Spiribacter sp. C176]|uniref:TrkA family potassium uptake protein n=1 Tax=Spiribacter salilacus TaxID=2664894 RepID=A0A6N7QTJ4_9GAMM|nr:NAD-binding protein [Spiribacter salilacus]MRH78729.1 TrkA family potassium uptake protein [Spiribacter salilacus]